MLFQPAPDHQRNRADVTVDRKELLAHVAAGRNETAIAGADRIDVDEVGEVEPGLGVGLNVGRRRRRHRIRVDGKAPGPVIAELQPGGRRARSAIEDESDGARRAIRPVQLVGGVGDVGLRFPLVVEQADRAGRCGKGERPAGQIEGLLGRRVGRQTVLIGARRRRSGAAVSCGCRPSGPRASSPTAAVARAAHPRRGHWLTQRLPPRQT